MCVFSCEDGLTLTPGGDGGATCLGVGGRLGPALNRR